MQKVRLKYLVDTRVHGAAGVMRMLDHPAKLLSTILLGNNLVNVGAAAIATTLAISYLPEEQGVLVATIATTVILLIFSETIPKTIATTHAEKLSLTYVRPIEAISWLFTPFVSLLSWMASAFSRLFGVDSVPTSLFSTDDIRTMISAGQQEGAVEVNEAKMYKKVFDFTERLAREVMVPRMEVVAIEQGSTAAEFMELYSQSPRSRFPVFHENMDNITGILLARDFFMAQAKGLITETSAIDSLVRPAYFSPETKHVHRLFQEMRDTNNQMAIIIDEFGGTAGIVSLVGLVEEIVGEIGDEYTSTENEFEMIDSNTYQIEGAMLIKEANEELGLRLPVSEDYDTVAGLILDSLGHIPILNEQITYGNIALRVTGMDGFKISSVQISLGKESEQEESGTGTP